MNMVIAPDHDVNAASPPLAALSRAERAPDLHGAGEFNSAAQIPATPGAGTPPTVHVTAGERMAPGAPYTRPVRPARKVAGLTLDEWIERARLELAAGKRGRPFLAALYAAAAAQKEGAAVEDCPFDPLTESVLVEEWRSYFRASASALRREAPATGARRNFQTAERRTRPARTASAAYAEQCGGVELRGDGE